MSEAFKIIRESVNMSQVAILLGYEPNRAGFIHSPFKEERTASCKLYEHSFYDFATNMGGDCILFTAQILKLDNWQAAKYLAQAFSLPIQLSGYIDKQPEIEQRHKKQQQQRQKEQIFREAWRKEVDTLKQLERDYAFAIEKHIFTPLSSYHARIVKRHQAISYGLDILCTGSRAEQEGFLREAGKIDFKE